MSGRESQNRARYNRMAGSYEALVRFGSLGQFSRLYRAVANAIEPTPGGRIVDVGCGPGTLTSYLLPKIGLEGSIVGTDIADEMIERARSRAEARGWRNVRFERSDVRDFSPDCKADVVIFSLSLTTMPDAKACLSRALSWLDPGGQLVILDSLLERDRLLASLAIRLKSPLVGADPAAVSLEHVCSSLDPVRVQRLLGGVYTLIWGRKPDP